jgi:hypothetical protein
MLSMPNGYFASTPNSHVDVATYSDSLLISSASNCLDDPNHTYHNFEYVQKSMSTMCYVSFNGISNIQRAPAYSHSSAIEQIHMPMNNYHDQTSMTSSANFPKALYVSGSSNGQEGVSSFYSSVENPHYMNQSQPMSMNERIGQFNSGYAASYSQCSYATPYIVEKEVTPTCSVPYVSYKFHDSVPYFSNDYSKIDENSSNTHTSTCYHTHYFSSMSC